MTLQVSVIVPVYNDVDRVEACIKSLKSQSLKTDLYEIIIVDNGSKDGTYELLSKIEGIELLKCTTPGSYAARNTGIEVARGNFFAFTDSDCIATTNWLSELISKHTEGTRDVIVAGKVEFFQDSSKLTEQRALDFENTFSMKQDENAALGTCITANFFCKKELIKKHGRFNQNLKSGGDVDLSRRVTNSGGSVIYAARALVSHPSRNVRELLIKRRRVVGGSWDSGLAKSTTTAKIKFLVRLLKTFCRRSFYVLFKSKLSLKRRLYLTILLSQITATSYSELFNLMIGKDSKRV